MKRKPSTVHATYDEEADALAFELISTGKAARTYEIRPDLYVDIDRSGAIVAIEVLQASSKYDAEILSTLPTPGPLLTLNEAARLASLSPATIRKQIHNQRVPATKQGRDWFVSRKDIMAYLKNRSSRGRRSSAGAA